MSAVIGLISCFLVAFSVVTFGSWASKPEYDFLGVLLDARSAVRVEHLPRVTPYDSTCASIAVLAFS